MMDEEAAAVALVALNENEAMRDSDIAKIDHAPVLDDTKEENDSNSPIFDVFYSVNGSASVLQMTNMSSVEFQQLWVSFQPCIEAKWNRGRGRRSVFSGMIHCLSL